LAINTYQTYLMHKASAAAEYSKLVDIKDFPDLGGTPEMLETTTLSDPMQTFIAGIQTLDSSGLQFTCNYTKSDFTTLKALESDSEHEFAVWFGATTSGSVDTPSGADGKFSFKGQLSVYPSGGGVNEVVDMIVSIAPATKISFA
jgi:hypothetical protein